jgi:hypothetical protein
MVTKEKNASIQGKTGRYLPGKKKVKATQATKHIRMIAIKIFPMKCL